MSDLSNNEFCDFLDEIKSEDKEFKIAGMTQRESCERAVAARREKAAERKRREQEIIQESINSTFIDLNAPLSVAHKRILIKLLTDNYTALMMRHEQYINTKIYYKLRQLIPRDLFNAWTKYKNSFIPLQGFMYTASKEYGQGLQFKVSVDLPYYFEPEYCEHLFKENWPQDAISVDKAVAFFHKYKNTRSEREVKIAEQLTRVSTFFQLVKKNPFWYDKLVQELKKRDSDERASGDSEGEQ